MALAAASSFPVVSVDKQQGGSSAKSKKLKQQQKNKSISDEIDEALQKLEQDPDPDHSAYGHLLLICGRHRDVAQGKRVYAQAAKHGMEDRTFVANNMLQMYRLCGQLDDAQRVFDGLQRKNVMTWNMLLRAYAEAGHLQEAEKLFHEVPNRSQVSWNTMVAAYAQNGHLHKARALFCDMPARDTASWSTMISAYGEAGDTSEAVRWYFLMLLDGVQPNAVTFMSVIGRIEALRLGKSVHGTALESGACSDVGVATALVDMYGKCRSLKDAEAAFYCVPDERRSPILTTAMITAYASNGEVDKARNLFDSIVSGKDVVVWTAIVTGYAQNRCGFEALELFLNMDLDGVQPNNVSFISALDACACSPKLLEQGKLLHRELIDRRGALSDVIVCTALLNMYARCGQLGLATNIFEATVCKSTVSWNCMIVGNAHAGNVDVSLELFHEMLLEGSCWPSPSTLTGILFACSHAGLLTIGLHYWRLMIADFGIQPGCEQYVSMVDLISRCGNVKMAEELIRCMPYEPDFVAWSSLFSSCKAYSGTNQAAAVEAAEQMLALRPTLCPSFATDLAAIQLNRTR